MNYFPIEEFGKSSINKKYLIIMAISMMLMGHNDILSIISMVVVSVILIYNIRKEEFLFSYFVFVFFEPVLVIPFIGGSFFRIYQFIFFLRIIIDSLNKFKYRKSRMLNVISALIFFLLSLLYSSGLLDTFSMAINMFIIIYIITSFKGKKPDVMISKIFVYVAIFTALSGIYGLFFLTPLDYGYIKRIVGTMGDPNYSAMFYTLGLFSVLGNQLITKKSKIVLIGTLSALLISSISISGILGSIVLLMVYVWLIKPRKGLMVGIIMLIIFMIFMSIDFRYGTSLYAIKFRITSIFATSDLDTITSSRTSIAYFYMTVFAKLPLINKLFGGNNTVSGPFRDNMVKTIGSVSHLSYIDMLYMVGIIGTIIILGLFAIMLIRNIKMYWKTKNKVYLSITLVKMTIMYYSLSLSIFPFRYFYTFFLI